MSTRDAYKTELSAYLDAFATNVRRLRLRRRISQEMLSALTGLHRTEIGRIEQGAVEPRLTTLVILADALGVRLDDLVAGLWVPLERRPSPQADSVSGREQMRPRLLSGVDREDSRLPSD
jgi:transcriptional regulator with XRE-family HTH domain